MPVPGSTSRIKILRMKRILTCLLAAALCLVAAVPSPKEHLGYTPGDDYKLADYADIGGDFPKLGETSGRLRGARVGRPPTGAPQCGPRFFLLGEVKEMDRTPHNT